MQGPPPTRAVVASVFAQFWTGPRGPVLDRWCWLPCVAHVSTWTTSRPATEGVSGQRGALACPGAGPRMAKVQSKAQWAPAGTPEPFAAPARYLFRVSKVQPHNPTREVPG